tara:strand:- start:271 stop:1503 length:1233 start_codon:yes stop_codon:yes gene_type:complete
MYNGKPVKGVKGACPTNSTWVEEPSTPSKSDGNFFDRYVTDDGNINYGKAALEATYLTPLGLGRGLLMKGGKYALDKVFRKNLTGKALEEQIKRNQLKNVSVANTNKFGLANPTTRNIPGKPARASNMLDQSGRPINLPPIPASTVTTPARNVLAPFNAQAGQRGMKQLMDNMGSTRTFAPLRTAGIGAAGLAGYDQFGPGLTQASKEIKANQAASAQAIQNKAIEDNTQALAQRNATEAATKAEADRVASLNPMERMMENLKTPGFLNESMSGAKGDTRLNRLGQLMSYYGSTPKQRAKMKNPMDRFAAIEKGVMDNATALAKAQATLKSQYGKPTVSNLAEGMFDLVKDAYGGTWLPFDDKSDDELKRISSLAAIRLTELAQDPNYMNLGEEQLRGEAVRQVGEELGL